MEDKDVYDTSIYVDYTDLPKQKQKELYKEYLATDANEKRLSLWFMLTPAVFGAGILALLIAALIVFFAQGLELPFIILIVATGVALLCYVIVSLKLDKVRHNHEIRFAAWLKTEKHVIAEIKGKP